jgi:hypothetical protein
MSKLPKTYGVTLTTVDGLARQMFLSDGTSELSKEVAALEQ